MTKTKNGIVLAAGRGVRLAPLTDSVPKPLLCYQGVPFLEMSLKSMEEAGVANVTIVTGYLEEAIKAYVRNRKNRCSICFVTQTDLVGSADALGQALANTAQELASETAVVAADYVLPDDTINNLFSSMSKNRTDGVVLTSSAREEGARKSSVVTKKRGLVSRIDEKPEWIEPGVDYEVCKLCYVFSAETLGSLRVQRQVNCRQESIPDRINFAIQNGARISSLFLEALPDAEEVL